MRRQVMKKLVLTGALLALSAAPGPAYAAAARFKKIVIVIFENTDFDEAMRQPAWNRLASEGALLTNMTAEARPSQPNYLALVSGSPQGVNSDGVVDLDAKHVGDLLEARGLGWAAYAEGYPGGCFTGEKKGDYARKHVPFMDFKNVRGAPERCARIVPAERFAGDARNGKLPEFSLYVPDMRNDGHDTSPEFAARWFGERFLPALKGPSGALPKDLLLVVTFDESNKTPDNRIYTALVGAGVKPGAWSAKRYNHYSLLRMIEDRFKLGTLGKNDERANGVDDVWK